MHLKKILAYSLILMLAVYMFAPAGIASAQSGNPLKNIAVTGSNPDGGSFTGTFSVERFAAQGNSLVAIGRLNGTLQGAPGNANKEVKNQPARMPVKATSKGATSSGASASGQDCPILSLVLGPLDINLLGLRIQLNQVELDITAQSGSGNLLGNLLCQIAGLLDGGGPLSRIVDLLNRILSALG